MSDLLAEAEKAAKVPPKRGYARAVFLMRTRCETIDRSETMVCLTGTGYSFHDCELQVWAPDGVSRFRTCAPPAYPPTN